MILDSSAIVAMVADEPEQEVFFALTSAARCRISVGTWLETCLVVDNRSLRSAARLDRLLSTLAVELVAVDSEQARIARAAHRRFGRGSGSPARLNFGDCFAYALSVVTGEPLLFRGDDFKHTDVLAAWSPGREP